MYPLTENFPKPLLDIKGKALIDYLIDDLENNKLIDEYIIVSNHKFINHFVEWKNKHSNTKITVLDDGSTDNDNRLGAVKDIELAIKKAGWKLLTSIQIFDLYPNIEENKKSMAYKLCFQDASRTLEDEEVMQVFNNIITNVTSKFNAKVRDK